jgi:hypothetical protein
VLFFIDPQKTHVIFLDETLIINLVWVRRPSGVKDRLWVVQPVTPLRYGTGYRPNSLREENYDPVTPVGLFGS